jgi:hypothetical protein
VKPLTEEDIRRSFVNCSKGEAQRLHVPRDLDQRGWDDLDFLGWRDPGAPERAYLVAERDGGLTGVAPAAGADLDENLTPASCCISAGTVRGTFGSVGLKRVLVRLRRRRWWCCRCG